MVSDTWEPVYLKRMLDRREGLMCGVKSLRMQKRVRFRAFADRDAVFFFFFPEN